MAKSHTQEPNHTTLYGENDIDSYVMSHSDPEPDYLHRLWRDTNIHMLHGRMASGHLQGRLLKMLVEMIRPDNILEVGTFSGYSALCMAEGLSVVHGDDMTAGHLYTYEINDEQEDFTRPWIEQSPWAGRVTFIIGDAAEEVPPLSRRQGLKFDMVFMDGDKRTYRQTYDALFPCVADGGYIIADNTLWDGHVVDSSYARDPQTAGIRDFNARVAADTRVTRVMIPLRDGLTIIRKNIP